MSATRYILITLLKIVVVIALIMLLFVIGMMIGYGVIGGGKPLSVFSHDLWNHIFTFFK
ncbi:DNA-directed RNA polymerase subunit beta [Enterococcus sp. JM4C]|uniref:DNA-directed RNA polymerase subunit beta n=1 Tax=Candidatus Enterococcus huntleyi TaxID=1857217 RepID=UPI00137A6B7D|nr:DNA-directed RNA polymerase subunit beta [Enterococcus sp. JM4C]KAF1295755.1 DNA-directed RNA polymerase subunit beta [Enterococcus sp. JM4C]